MATTWCRYASGEEPWTPLGSEGVVKVFDVGEREKECELGELDRRKWERWEVMERLGVGGYTGVFGGAEGGGSGVRGALRIGVLKGRYWSPGCVVIIYCLWFCFLCLATS